MPNQIEYGKKRNKHFADTDFAYIWNRKWLSLDY